jgi:hypothetical protein
MAWLNTSENQSFAAVASAANCVWCKTTTVGAARLSPTVRVASQPTSVGGVREPAADEQRLQPSFFNTGLKIL